MRVRGKEYKTVWMKGGSVFLIDQTRLPFSFKVAEARTYLETCRAIETMAVRGAGAIGAAAGFAMAQVVLEASKNHFLNAVKNGRKRIERTRPTARNLFYAVERVFQAAARAVDPKEAAVSEALRVVQEDERDCRRIGEIGATLIQNGMWIGTHCNAGWLAFVDFGTALAPVYAAARRGKKLFVYVDETRPRSQGAKLTAWELQNERIEHAIIADNACAWLLSRKKIHLMIVGADRIAANGDVANKIGTLEKAICAKEFGVPFYVAAPTSTIDRNCASGSEIPIEERSEEEVLYERGLSARGREERFRVAAPGSKGINPAFDVTPAKYISGIITEKGIIGPSERSIRSVLKTF